MPDTSPASNLHPWPAFFVERRAHTRYPLYLDAILVVEGRELVACRIRDFCLGGLHVAFESGAEQTSQHRAYRVGDHVAVHFSVAADGKTHSIRMPATVARVFGSSLGLAFVRPDGEALRLLHRIATASRGGLDARPSTSGLDVRRIVGHLHETITRHEGPMLRAFLHKADSILFTAARDAGTNAEQTSYFDAMAELKRNRAAIESDISHKLVEQVDRLAQPGWRSEPPKRGGSAELSLIDKDAFEDLLAVANLVDKVENQYREVLFEIEKRLSHLTHSEIDKANNPVGPSAVCHAFADACQTLRSSPRAIRLIYQAFEEAVIPLLGPLYEELNAELRNNGVLPVLERRPVTPQRRESPVQPSWPAEGAGAQQPAVTEAPPGGSYRAAAVPPQAGPAPAAGAADPGGAVQPPYAPAEAMGQELPGAVHAVAVPRMQRAYGVAQTLLGLRRQVAAPQGAAAQPAVQPSPPGATYASSEVLDALSALQQEDARNDATLARSPSDFKQLLLERLRTSHGGAARELGAVHSDLIDTVAGLLTAMLEDLLLSDGIKHQLIRLRAPLHKVALLDEQFLQAESHPARQFVNQLAQLSPDPSSTLGLAEQEQVAALVDRIAREYDRDTGIFADVLPDLNRLVEAQKQAYEENVERVIHACEEQQAVFQSRRRVKPQAGPELREAPKPARPVPEEWNKWLHRAKRLKPGDELVLMQGRRNRRVTLVWVGEDYNPFVFVDPHGMKAAVMALQELAMQMRRGTAIPVEAASTPLVDRALNSMLTRMHGDIAQQASADPLTGLPGRKAIESRIQAVLAAGRTGAVHTLAILSLHPLKSLNDTQGRGAGDVLLKQVAELLDGALVGVPGAMLARSGGEEFALWLPDFPLDRGRELASRLAAAVEAQCLQISEERRGVRIAVGLASTSESIAAGSALLEAAESALAGARASPEEHIAAFVSDADMRSRQERIVRALVREDRLDESCLELALSPLIPIGRPDEAGAGCDARPRARVPGGLELSGAALRHALALAGQARALDRWLLRAALQWMAEDGGKEGSCGMVVVGVSDDSLSDPQFIDHVMERLMETKVPPGRLCLEFTDSGSADAASDALELIRSLGEFGCRFSLAGFGAGSSSYARLKDLAVDYVRIDAALVRDVACNANDYAIVKSVNEIAHFMGRETVADLDGAPGTVLDTLREIGIDYAAGTPLRAPAVLEGRA